MLTKKLRDQFSRQIKESWFLKNDIPKHSYNQYFGNLCASIVAYHLEQQGYQINGLDARDPKNGILPDISASKDQLSFGFEVKHYDIRGLENQGGP